MDPQQGPPQPDLLIGQTIGNYLVTQKLGEGGMGSVYLAEHPSIGKKVALKVLHSEFSNNQEVAARFFHEAKAVNDIGHPNIVDVVDFGIIQAGGGRDQLVYFIMEYLAGLTLSQLIRNESPLPPERALMIALQVADALSASHKCGIVHRDLKPDNIILLQRGRERDFVKLLDFGIAKLTGGSAMGSHRTRTGIVMGTPAYMSPEQCEGRDSVDLRTDVYALGIVMYEMLTGRVPFLGEGYGEILVQHLTQRPTPPSQFRMLPPHVEIVVMKALEKRADMRYPTMDELMRALSDPVGYVEANGGIGGFLQRQLMPSTGPLPSGIRLTPPPMIPTPLPGTLIAPARPSIASIPPGAPTVSTLTGQVQPAPSKLVYVIAAAVIVAAVIAIAAVVSRSKPPAIGDGSGIASGSQIAVADPGSAAHGSAGGSAGAMVGSSSASTSSAAAGSATIPPTAGSGSAGSAEPQAGSASAPHGGSDTTGSGDGSGGRAADPDEKIEITVTSSPPGAKIFVDGVETGKVTPNVVRIPIAAGKKVPITLRLRGYNTYSFKADASESSQLNAELVKTKTSGAPPGSGSAVRPPPPITRPPTTGSSDPDGLMRP